MGTIDAQLLAEYMVTFYGYGNYNGRYWFIGIEEGGAKTLEDNEARITKWDRQGGRELGELILTEWRKPQKTWGRLIRILLSSTSDKMDEASSVTAPAVLAYQRHRLGREDGDTCLVELLPLSSKSVRHWMWGGLPELPHLHLHTRKAYQEHYSPIRAAHIATRIREHKPRFVIFYGFTWTYRRWWHRIADVPFEEISTGGDSFYLGHNDHTIFAIVKHPALQGMSHSYFHEVGYALAQRQKDIGVSN